MSPAGLTRGPIEGLCKQLVLRREAVALFFLSVGVRALQEVLAPTVGAMQQRGRQSFNVRSKPDGMKNMAQLIHPINCSSKTIPLFCPSPASMPIGLDPKMSPAEPRRLWQRTFACQKPADSWPEFIARLRPEGHTIGDMPALFMARRSSRQVGWARSGRLRGMRPDGQATAELVALVPELRSRRTEARRGTRLA